MIQKPGIGPNVKEIKPPKEDDKKNFNFIYCMRKQQQQLVDSSDEEAVAAEKARVEAELNKVEEPEPVQAKPVSEQASEEPSEQSDN